MSSKTLNELDKILDMMREFQSDAQTMADEIEQAADDLSSAIDSLGYDENDTDELQATVSVIEDSTCSCPDLDRIQKLARRVQEIASELAA